MNAIDISTLSARGLDFTVRLAGPAAGEPVMLLHGFPETSAMWAALMAELAAGGRRCAAPDQRGYSPGARPATVAAYGYDELAADVFALADRLGWGRFHLVAHDWGAGVGWRALRQDAARVASFTALSIPHYRAFAEATWEDADAEPYRRFLQLAIAPDGAAERVLGRDDLASFRATWAADAELVEAYVGVLREPGALTGALNWYRAADAHRRILAEPAGPADEVTTPTLLIWGRDDPYVRPGALARAGRFMRGPYRVLELDTGHWLAQQASRAVAQAVLDHIDRHRL